MLLKIKQIYILIMYMNYAYGNYVYDNYAYEYLEMSSIKWRTLLCKNYVQLAQAWRFAFFFFFLLSRNRKYRQAGWGEFSGRYLLKEIWCEEQNVMNCSCPQGSSGPVK